MKDPELPLSIVIATFNRAAILSDALCSLSLQKMSGESGPDIPFEIIVVDNNSADDTYSIVKTWQETLPHLLYVHESTQGVSHARNRGISEARGKHILFFDDECTIGPDFVARLCARLTTQDPAIFGGPVFPRYAAYPPRPKWYKDSYGSFSVFGDRTSLQDIWLSGANLGGRSSALQEIGGFSEHLGPRGRRMAYGEEQDLVFRAQQRFGTSCISYFFDLPAYHLVKPVQYKLIHNLSEQFIRGYWRGFTYRDNLLLSRSNDTTRSLGLNRARFWALFRDLMATPLGRSRTRFPFLQNYIIEVVGPALRLVSFYFGRASAMVPKRGKET